MVELANWFRENLKQILPDQLAVGEDKTHIDGVLKRMHRWHQVLTIFYIPLVVTLMIFSCFWAYKEGSFQKYLDPTKDWEACLTTSNFVQIPVAEAVNIGFANLEAKFNDVLSQVFECPENLSQCDNSTTCVSAISSTCFAPLVEYGQNLTAPAIPNTAVRVGELLESLRYIGFQSVVFSLISHGALNRALRHPTWLPATIAVMIWSFFAVLTYYTIEPIIPVPTETNGTTLLFFYYAKQYIFDNINSGDNVCSTAFQLLWAYLTLLLCILANMLGCIVLACRAEYVRLHLPNRKQFQPLNYTRIPAILCVLIILVYSLIVILKIITSFTMISAVHDFHRSFNDVVVQGTGIWFDNNFYPFQKGSLDLNSLLFLGTIASVIRGYSRESTSAFRLAATMSFAYVITSYPGIVGAFRFYVYNDFQNYSSCKNFFLDAKYTGSYGYPSSEQAEIYCNCYRTSIGAALTLLILMHILLFTSASTYSDNMHQSSAIFEPMETQRGIMVRQSLLHPSSDALPASQVVADEYINPEGSIF